MIVPIVNADGTFGEMDISDDSSEYIKKIKKRKITSGFGFSVVEDVFKVTALEFRIDSEHFVCTKIYVHENFKAEFTTKEREFLIEDYLKQNSPWVFSYGKRYFIRDWRKEFS